MQLIAPALILLSATPAERPKIALHPLVVSGVETRHDRDELLQNFSQLVKSSGDVEVLPQPQLSCVTVDADHCLAAAAQKAGAHYALAMSLERGLKRGEWRISVVLMRADGGIAARPDVATFSDVKGGKFSELASNELTQALARLELGKLPTLDKPADAPATIPPPPITSQESIEPPGGGGLRASSYVLGGLGLIGLASGVVFTALSNSDATALKADLVMINGKPIGIPPADKPLAQRLDVESNGAIACYIGGAVLLATGVLLFALSSDDTPSVAWVPLRGGGAAVLSGKF
jgi:hypothetical protein